MSTYTYTLDGTTVTPVGEWTISYERNAGQIFFRRILRGDLTFKDADYTFITGQSVCTDLEFKILCDGAEYWVGSIKYPYGFSDVDTDQCWITGTPEVVDEYTCIMQNYETEYFIPTFLGGINVVLQTCAAVFIANMNGCLPLGASTGSGVNNYFDEIINDINRMNCGLTLRSSFMWLDNFPDGTTVASIYGAGNNYITGATNRLNNIFLWRNQALRAQWGTGGCTDSKFDYWSFKTFEEFIRNAFNAYWYIDSNGHFRIEHIAYFLPTFSPAIFADGIDLTATGQRCLPAYASRKNKYTFLTDLLFDEEVWKWQYYLGTEGTIAHGTDFEGVPVYYNSASGGKYDCVPGDYKSKEFISSYFWSDIEWAQQLIAAGTVDSTIDCRGFSFIDVNSPYVTPTVRCEVPWLTGGGAIINGHLSTGNLQHWYHQYDRIFLTGWMNSNLTTFDSEIRKELQTEIEFPWCCEDTFDPLDFIVTELGSGAVYSAELSRLRKSLIVELTY